MLDISASIIKELRAILKDTIGVISFELKQRLLRCFNRIQ